MNREDEIKERQRRRSQRWYNSLTPEQRKPNKKILAQLRRDGYVDENNLITEKGELYLHQLRILEWMVKNERTKK